MKELTINPELTGQEESHNAFMHWLLNNPNNFSFWFPFVENLSLYGIRIPKSVIMKVPDNIIRAFFLEEENDRETIMNWVKDSVKPIIDREFPDGPVFIKNGCFSNKFQFSRNCLVKERDVQTLFNHIVSIQYDSFCFDTCGNAEIVVREWIEPKVDLGCIYDGMPLRPELRVFYDFDKKEILYTANYWDWDYCHEGISRHPGDAKTYEKSYPELLSLLNEYSIRWMPIIDQALSRVRLKGQWSVDFILENDRPILIDMALARQSAYWDPDKIYR